WDTEIKQAQRMGLADYPVYTRKTHTDVSYIACVRQLFKSQGLFPQFATHNAHSIATVRTLAPADCQYEFQRLHGMAESLYDPLVADGLPCRVYAPVGSHKHLLAYLVRRLLENGANNSFVNRIHKRRYSMNQLVRDPVEVAREQKCLPHPSIPLPEHIYGSGRENAPGIDISQPPERPGVQQALKRFKPVDARPLVPDWDAGENPNAEPVTNPAQRKQILGTVVIADRRCIEQALDNAEQAWARWNDRSVESRARILEQAAHRLILFQPKLATLLVKEAGKTWPAALAEVREAVDLCRYYAQQARLSLTPRNLPGPTGEENRYISNGRGPMLCISPWNFPLAIFTGQIAAALVAGNPVIAKPAAQTPLIAFVVVRLLHRAGVPKSVLQLLPGPGERIAKRLLADSRLQGLLFTGSFATAQSLQRQIAGRPGPIIPLIAETGGLNAMLVDSSALPEQVVADVLRSAFDSAGQRCSALRILCLQEDIADDVETMLAGAMAEMHIDDPSLLNTDVGPLIDAGAKTRVQRHLRRLRSKARLIAEAPMQADTANGYFLAPQAWAIQDLNQVPNEVFGPILHVLRYKAEDFENLIDTINATGYALTSGLHSRIAARHEVFQKKMQAGNLYINRDMIAAVPGSQPFGG
ncbi:MAG: bifunctional proline dehydrogenase/L-glutamate gamma-semialdehyde dehydrogenase PutA, partial [Salinisphaeraceae bacterium]|nr:bifunctional proline dehydrogenase/L-glutamate gamma-semialdehyde dehydrogenase PutA [Salinisphaeraceae bacterium]